MVTSTIKKGFYRACSNKIFVEMEDLKVKFLQKKLIGKTDSKSYHPRKKPKLHYSYPSHSDCLFVNNKNVLISVVLVHSPLRLCQ